MTKDIEENFLSFEEDFHTDDKRDFKKERKRARAKDRSRFKKSDQDQLKKAPPPSLEHLIGLPKGRVIAILLEGILVSLEGKEWICSIKGTLKQLKEKSKNLVAVGDLVYFEDLGNAQGSIVHVDTRFSILSRADHLSQNKEQLIAVNIDQVLITNSVCSPPLKPFLIDRYLIAAEKGNLKPIIIINKIDLLEKEGAEIEKQLYTEVIETYEKLGIPILGVSTHTGEGMDALKALMKNKTSVFSGQSGTGKSSLINATVGTALTTGAVVLRTHKGSHTTSTTELIPLECGGWCIDTPGVQSFGIWDIDPLDIASYYSEITALRNGCKFADCSHLNEQECAVRQAVEEGCISPLRFASYYALMASLSELHHPR